MSQLDGIRPTPALPKSDIEVSDVKQNSYVGFGEGVHEVPGGGRMGGVSESACADFVRIEVV